jgi:hypothetical protein
MQVTKMTLADAAEQWIIWAKANRTEKYWKRQERILREDVLPAIGHLSIWESPETSIQSALSIKESKQATAAYNTVSMVVGWKLKHL